MTTIDFETYYEDGALSVVNRARRGSGLPLAEGQHEYCNIKVQGNYNYPRHPLFQILCLAVYPDEAEQGVVVTPDSAEWDVILNWLREYCEKGGCVAAHNAAFDVAILHTLGIYPKRFVDTAALAAFLQIDRSLSGVVEFMGYRHTKAVRTSMKNRRLETLTQAETAELGRYCGVDALVASRFWRDYSKYWPDYECALATHTATMGLGGIGVDTDLLIEQGATIEREMRRIETAIPWDGTPLSPLRFGEHCRTRGVAPPKSMAEDNPDTIEWSKANRGHECARLLEDMRSYRKLGLGLKRLSTIWAHSRDGVFHYGLKYAEAHTRRWSGGGGVNLHGLPREPVLPGCDLRHIFVPRDGCKFLIGDYAQIEARTLLWLAGDAAAMERLRAGVSVYQHHAEATMGWPEGRPLKKENPDLYRLAKARVLGLGYGCGAKTFVRVALTMCGLKLSEAEAGATVAEYRAKNPKIRDLWKKLDGDIRQAAHRTDKRSWAMPTPSGMPIVYANLQCHEDGKVCGDVGTAARCQKKMFWGGLLTENLVQCVARDILADAVLRCEIAGMRVILHVHDEIVVEVGRGRTKAVGAEDLKALMETPPEWAADLPIEAEVKESNKYEK